MTTFLLPSGRYRYLKAPMGLFPSSDEFNARTDPLFEDLDYVLKIMDDVWIQATTVAELCERLRVVFSRCRSGGLIGIVIKN